MSSHDPIWILVLGFAAIAALFISLLSRRSMLAAGEEINRNKARRHQQQLDRQNNIGRRIYNHMVTFCNRIPDPSLRVDKIEENGNHFTVFIGREDHGSSTYGGPGYPGFPVVNVSVYVLDEPSPYLYVYQGAYGPFYKEPVDAFECDATVLYSLLEGCILSQLEFRQLKGRIDQSHI